MKIGIVGTGSIVRSLQTPICELVNEGKIEELGIWGKNRDTRKEIADFCKISNIFETYEDLLKSDFDTIYLALPNHLHYVFAKQALEKGKHVIVEKPITSNIHELKKLIGLAEKNHLILLEAMTVPYLPAFCSMNQNLEKVGKIRIAVLNYSQYSSRYDDFKNGNISPVFDAHRSGGALMDLNVYNIHAAVKLFGVPSRICYMANMENGIDTSGNLLMDYQTFKVTCIGAKDCCGSTSSYIQGELGTLVLEQPINALKNYIFVDCQKQSQPFSFETARSRFYYEFERFAEIINQEDWKTAKSMLEISRKVVVLLDQARQQAGIIFDNDF